MAHRDWDGFDWDEANVEHIQAHGVSPFEVEEAALGRVVVHPAKTIKNEDRSRLLGKTQKGRYLVVVYPVRNRRFRTVTAHPMHQSERRTYGPQLDSPEESKN